MSRFWLFPLLTALATTVATAQEAAAYRPRTRLEFARALRTIERSIRTEVRRKPAANGRRCEYEVRGMPMERVRRLLGPPDDVLVDPVEIPEGTTRVTPQEGEQIWRYGVRRHLGFATLGEVSFNDRSMATGVVGSFGNVIPASLVPEPELRSLLTELGDLPEDPVYLARCDSNQWIRVANHLHALGRKRALAVVGEYLRLHKVAAGGGFYIGSGPHALHTVMRLLFPTAHGTWGGMNRIVYAENFPLVLPYRKRIDGPVSFTFEEFGLYQKGGFWRRQAFLPPENLVAEVDSLCAQPAHRNDIPELRGQALLLLHTVYRTGGDRTLRQSGLFGGEVADTAWTGVRSEVSRLPIRWNDALGIYTFMDGTTLPDLWTPQHWSPDSKALPGSLHLRRTHSYGIEVRLEWTGPPPAQPIVLVARRNGLPFASLRTDGWVLDPREPWTRWLWLCEDSRIEFEISTGPVTRTSPVLVP